VFSGLEYENKKMSIDLKRKVSFFILELILGILIGLLAVSFSEKILDYTDSIIMMFVFVYIMAMIGILIPGYFFLRLNGNKEVFIGAIFSSIVWTLFAIFLYIILAYLGGIDMLQSKESGLIFPVIFGVIGFNHFAYHLKNYTKTD
jgi:hypothetical protein